MDPSLPSDNLIENVKAFVKICREKNKKLLELNPTSKAGQSGSLSLEAWDNGVLDKYLKKNSSYSSELSILEKPADHPHRRLGYYSKADVGEVQPVFVTTKPDPDIESQVDPAEPAEEVNDANDPTEPNDAHDPTEPNEANDSGESNRSQFDPGESVQPPVRKGILCHHISFEDSASLDDEAGVAGGGSRELGKKRSFAFSEPDRAKGASGSQQMDQQTFGAILGTMRSEILEDNKNLSRLYRKLKSSGSRSSQLKRAGTKKKKAARPKYLKKPVPKKKKLKNGKKVSMDPLNLEQIEQQSREIRSKKMESVHRDIRHKQSKSSQFSREFNKGFKNSLSISSKKHSTMSLSNLSSRRITDRLLILHDGVRNRLRRRAEGNSNFSIGGVYLAKESNELEWPPYHRRNTGGKNGDASSKRATKRQNTDLSEAFPYMKKGTGEKSAAQERKKHKNASDVVAVINGLLSDYVPKLIGRYENCIANMNKENEVLKRKVRESLDVGDLQYEEIRELKMQVIQESNKNKKLNDTINTLKDKISFANDLDAKNLEYLDEIMILKNRIKYMEKLFEENNKNKETEMLKKMRNDTKVLYSNLKNELHYVKLLKKKIKKKNAKKKFSLKKWSNLLSKYPKLISIENRNVSSSSSTTEPVQIIPQLIMQSPNKLKRMETEAIQVATEEEEEEKEKEEEEEEPKEAAEEEATPAEEPPRTARSVKDVAVETTELKPEKVEATKHECEQCAIHMDPETIRIFKNFMEMLMTEQTLENKRKILEALHKNMKNFHRYLIEYVHSMEKKKKKVEPKKEEKKVAAPEPQPQPAPKAEPVKETHLMTPKPCRPQVVIPKYRSFIFYDMDEFNRRKEVFIQQSVDPKTDSTVKKDVVINCLENIRNSIQKGLQCCPCTSDNASVASIDQQYDPNRYRRETRTYRDLDQVKSACISGSIPDRKIGFPEHEGGSNRPSRNWTNVGGRSYSSRSASMNKPMNHKMPVPTFEKFRNIYSAKNK